MILISIDSLRPDHLGAYGYARDTSPRIDRLAKNGTLFIDAVSQATWTLPSVSSLFLSQYVSTHGIERPDQRIPDDARTLAEVLRDHGYDTAAFMIGVYTSRDFGMDQGFDHFVENGGKSEQKNRLILDWLRGRTRRFFAYVHYVDVHYPYVRENPYRKSYGAGYRGMVNGRQRPEQIRDQLGPEDVQHLIDLYDDGVSSMDSELGKLLSEIESLPIGADTVIILTADHGEAFFEHKRMLGHRGAPYEELIRVPLIMTGPRLPSGRIVREPVEQVDIAPTIFDLCGIPRPSSVQGQSLLPLIHEDTKHKAYTFSEYLPAELKAIRGSQWKLIADYRLQKHELFDLSTDPKEQSNVASQRGEVVEGLLGELSSFISANQANASQERAVAADVRESTKEQLRALGYVD